MTRDRLNKREIRVLQEQIGLSYVEARQLLIAFRDVLDREPHLSTNGFGLPRYGQRTLADQREQFRVFREELEGAAVRVIEGSPVAAREHPADQDTGAGQLRDEARRRERDPTVRVER